LKQERQDENRHRNRRECRCCVEAKKRVKIIDAADDTEDDDDNEYFDAIEDIPVSVKALTLPRRPKR